jgi:hypothetical protein
MEGVFYTFLGILLNIDVHISWGDGGHVHTLGKVYYLVNTSLIIWQSQQDSKAFLKYEDN